MRKTVIISVVGIILLFTIGFAMARVSGIPVKLRMIGKPRYAVAGEPFRASIIISAAADAELSKFKASGGGWSVEFLDVSGVIHLKADEGVIVNIEATPEDPSKPLILSFAINGQIFSKAFDLSKHNYDNLMNPPHIKSVPGSEEIPFPGVDHSRASPGIPSDEEDTDSILYRILKELRFIRGEVNRLSNETYEIKQIILGDSEGLSADIHSGVVKVSMDDDPVMGDMKAPVTIIAFSDYRCSECTKFYKETFPLLKKRFIDPGVVRYVFRDFIHENDYAAVRASHAANCAGKQGKYWNAYNELYASRRKFNENAGGEFARTIGVDEKEYLSCISDKANLREIKNDSEEGVVVGISQAPAFIIGKPLEDDVIEGYLLRNYRSFESFKIIINSLLEE